MTTGTHPEPTMAQIEDLKHGDIFYVEGHAFRFESKEEAMLMPDGGTPWVVETAAGTQFLFGHGDYVRAIQYNVKPKE
jgi:hypothetical protein